VIINVAKISAQSTSETSFLMAFKAAIKGYQNPHLIQSLWREVESGFGVLAKSNTSSTIFRDENWKKEAEQKLMEIVEHMSLGMS
jgi:hypothetical protein